MVYQRKIKHYYFLFVLNYLRAKFEHITFRGSYSIVNVFTKTFDLIYNTFLIENVLIYFLVQIKRQITRSTITGNSAIQQYRKIFRPSKQSAMSRSGYANCIYMTGDDRDATTKQTYRRRCIINRAIFQKRSLSFRSEIIPR